MRNINKLEVVILHSEQVTLCDKKAKFHHVIQQNMWKFNALDFPRAAVTSIEFK